MVLILQTGELAPPPVFPTNHLLFTLKEWKHALAGIFLVRTYQKYIQIYQIFNTDISDRSFKREKDKQTLYQSVEESVTLCFSLFN